MEQPAKSKRAATRGSWKPGQSGNVFGRPKLGETLADAMRDKFPPSRIAELAERLATEATSEQVRLAALQMIAERTHGKVTNETALTMHNGNTEGEYDFSAMSVDEQRELLAKLEAARVDGDPQLREPQVADDEAHRDTDAGTHDAATPRNPEAA